MELPHLGQACIICNRNDYLPFKCSRCEKIVCIDHRTNHGTECPLESSRFELTPADSCCTKSLKQACDYCRKITLKLELVECSHCKGLHCLYHRHQVQHKCTKLAETQETTRKETEARTERQKTALDKLRQNLKHSETSSSKPALTIQPLDSKKKDLARRVRLMKIKQFARGPPNVLQEDKIYFEIKFIHEPKAEISDAAKDGKSIKIFTTSKHTLGRMLDWSADELKVTNKNHLPSASQLIFKKQISPDEHLNLDSQVRFSDYLTTGELDEGDEIILTYKAN